MERYIDEESIYQLWLDFFGTILTEGIDYTSVIRSIGDKYPEERSLTVPFNDIFNYSGELAESLLDCPEMVLRVGEAAVNSLLEPDQKVGINLRVKDLYSRQHLQVKDIRAENLGKFIEFAEVNVTFASIVRPKLLMGTFTCTSCGFKQEIEQDPFHYTEPLECPKDDGGCGKRAGSTTFKFIVSESLFIDSQKIEIEDPGDKIEGRTQPKRTTVTIEDDLVDTVEVGDRVSIVGVVRTKQRKESGSKAAAFDTYAVGNNISFRDKIRIEETTEEEEELMEYIRTHDPLDLLVRSIAPSIYGYNHIKTCLALQYAGGVTRTLPDGSYQRGDIHLLLIGDPGTAKSKLARVMKKVHPRAIFTSGKGNSKAGLTAAVVKREDIDNRWGAEAGTMVLADMGLHITDEMDKMSPEDRSSMHDALEDQEITISKAGVHVTMMSRCANLGCANPKSGRYKPGIPASVQFDIEPPILSRHLVFAIIDQPNKETDAAIGERILLNRWGDSEDITPEIPGRIWNLYWFKIRNINPKGSKEQIKEAIGTYVDIRQEGARDQANLGGAVNRNITARQLEDIARLAEASARLRMDEEVSMGDVKLAIELVKKASQDATGAKDGWGDMSVLYKVRTKTDKQEYIIQTIDEMAQKLGEKSIGVYHDDIIEKLVSEGFKKKEMEKYLALLLSEGILFETGLKYYAVV